MLKFRSMHVGRGGSVITAAEDPRIFRFGRLIRKTKLDELPQFINVLKGEMSIVGPRPEDPAIVEAYYSDWMRETLDIRPGITSPGAVFYYSCAENLIDPSMPERSYAERVLPLKLAIDRAYIERASIAKDIGTIVQTALAIGGAVIGHPARPNRKDVEAAARWVPGSAFQNFL